MKKITKDIITIGLLIIIFLAGCDEEWTEDGQNITNSQTKSSKSTPKVVPIKPKAVPIKGELNKNFVQQGYVVYKSFLNSETYIKSCVQQ